jgi:hypothetical protein
VPMEPEDDDGRQPATRADRVIALVTLALGIGLALIALDVLAGGKIRGLKDGCGCDDDPGDSRS